MAASSATKTSQISQLSRVAAVRSPSASAFASTISAGITSTVASRTGFSKRRSISARREAVRRGDAGIDAGS
jgi:hypothetical protein